MKPMPQPGEHFMGRVRAIWCLSFFVAWSLILMPLQVVLIALKPSMAGKLAHFYYRIMCKVLGIKVGFSGPQLPKGACLILANHVSWLDILVLGSLQPLSFIAKSDVKSWPFFGQLAMLAQTIFIERNQRHRTGKMVAEIATRLSSHDALVLFAEGTSSAGLNVLPFRSSLIGAATKVADKNVPVVPMSIVYHGFYGVPGGRPMRPYIGWYGDMDLLPHLWKLLSIGPVDVSVIAHPPLTAADGERKQLAIQAQQQAANGLAMALYGKSALPVDEKPLNQPPQYHQ